MTEPTTRFKLEAPGGEVDISANCLNGRVLEVVMTPQPCFVVASDIQVNHIFSYCLNQLNNIRSMWCILSIWSFKGCCSYIKATGNIGYCLRWNVLCNCTN